MDDAEKALAALDKTTTQFRRTEKAHNAARDAATEAVITALRAGARPTEVTNRSPFSPAHVRNLARENGIEPARKGRPAPKDSDHD
ncbi:hypothetical protein E1281_01065 [Actinomadura sp. KC345]|uniref:hypothetical protein n=1 Tax=Actinomadura sp. KC345 TaxID=2530371 RepID=UPI00104765C1|nr:hypothetical protein [Actinomadura sp. KC345]TDC58572.1 hypothetical protein E1281_01065 [Actinomadura sp. KC345]